MGKDTAASSSRRSRPVPIPRRVSSVVRQVRRRIPVRSVGVSSSCNAPFASMYLDQLGNVRACCQNSEHTLGNVATDSLRSIWHGARLQQLRTAIEQDDFTLGCNFCRWQTEDGNGELVFARTFDHLSVPTPDLEWPRQLELSLSNACNLQCVMCNGDWSSSIRTHREGRPPLPVVYGEDFFDQLAEFLPHVEIVKILGGEPFLSRESLRVMEMSGECSRPIKVDVTTNGTQWTPRVERILESVPMNIVVSLDGGDAETYEAIRIGARFDEVVANVGRFQGFARTHGTTVTGAHCLMTSNWHRFADFMRFADEIDLSVYVNTVTSPVSMSLFHLPPDELAHVVAELEAVDAEVRADLRLNGAAWTDQLARLRRRLDQIEPGGRGAEFVGVEGFAWRDPGGATEADRQELDRSALELLTSYLGADAGPVRVEVSVDGIVTALDPAMASVLGVPVDRFIGHRLERLTEDVGRQRAALLPGGGVTDRLAGLRLDGATFDDGASFLSVTYPERDEAGLVIGITGYLGGAMLSADGPAECAQALADFRSATPVGCLVDLEIDQDRITSVTPSVVLDSIEMDSLVGRDLSALPEPFAARYGELSDHRIVVVESDRSAPVGLKAFETTFGGTHPRLRARSLMLLERDGLQQRPSRMVIRLEPVEEP